MGRGIIIGGSLVILLGCLMTIALAQSMWNAARQHIRSDPAQIEQMTAQMADFDLPSGYRPDYAVEFMGFTLVAYHPDDGQSHLMLLQAPPGVHIDQQELESQIANASQEQHPTRMTTLSTEKRLIRGGEATLVISEGVSGDGDRYRQCSLMFEGLTGTALILLSEPANRWDTTRMNTLIASIR
jgi:hypothetical protein